MAYSLLLILDGLAGQACRNLTDTDNRARQEVLVTGIQGTRAKETDVEPKCCGELSLDLRQHQILRASIPTKGQRTEAATGVLRKDPSRSQGSDPHSSSY